MEQYDAYLAAIVGYFLTCVVMILAAYGWAMNVYEIAQSSGGPLNGLFILRPIGIPVVPLGALLGFVG